MTDDPLGAKDEGMKEVKLAIFISAFVWFFYLFSLYVIVFW